MFVRVDGGYLAVFGWHNEDNRPEEQKRTLFGFLSKAMAQKTIDLYLNSLWVD